MPTWRCLCNGRDDATDVSLTSFVHSASQLEVRSGFCFGPVVRP